MTGELNMSVLMRSVLLICLSVGLSPQIAAAADDEEEAPENAKRCISTRVIRNTSIIDDRNIIFHVNGKKAYHNVLPRQCSGLEREDRFSYHTSSGRLCDMDSIRILYESGFGIREGNACSLGMFIPITDEDADALKNKEPEQPEAMPLPMPEPEEIGVEKDKTES
jgi:hypothetical protein